MPPRPDSRPASPPGPGPHSRSPSRAGLRPAVAPGVKPGLRPAVFAGGLACLALGLAALWLGGADLRVPGAGLLCMGVGLLWLVLRGHGAARVPAMHAGTPGEESLSAPASPPLAAAVTTSLSVAGGTSDEEQLNAALCAYVMTSPSPERLRAHLEANGLTAQAARFEGELKAVMRAAEEFIYAAAGKEKWDAAFNERFFQSVAKQHPWITRESFKSLGAFGQYLNWHDGLEL
ncbi:MAG: hypothetical protein JWN73_3878 [Betaproteobacteria bacterium]|nr:hypothetical protein [Betaproteobacteria bacterium]